MVIGFNLAGAAKGNFTKDPLIAIITLGSIALIGVISKGFLSRISIFLGLAVGYIVALIMGDVDTKGIEAASWFAIPTLQLQHLA
jgi:xanthine/uracil permease